MFRGELFAFQQPAVKAMLDRKKLLVAFEMGLGKTVIAIAAVESLGEDAAGLVIVPASLKHQWRRMIQKFTEDATVLLVEGSPLQRAQLYSDAVTCTYDYVLLNYEQVVNDWEYVRRLPRDYVVLDEATAIKSFRAKRSRRIKRLQAPYLWALTGQPVENRPEEVFSIMQFVDGEVLGGYEHFDRTFVKRNGFGGVQFYRNLPTLHRRLGEAMVRKRRDDPDVVDQLPRIVTEEVVVEFDRPGARLYRRIARDLLAELADAMTKYGRFDLWAHYSPTAASNPAEAAARGRIMSRLTCLRMLCDHPELLRWSADNYNAGGSKGSSGSVYAAALSDAGALDALKDTPKFDAACDIVDDVLAADPANKVVLFSFFKATLRWFQERYEGSVLFTGDMTPSARDAAKQAFATRKETRLFLSSDSGGVGLDIPEARYLISFNLPWSAGKLAQRNARIVRLSSEWESVTLVTMMMLGSIEERMFDLLIQKQAVADAVVDGKGIDARGRLQLNLATLSQFLQTSSV